MLTARSTLPEIDRKPLVFATSFTLFSWTRFTSMDQGDLKQAVTPPAREVRFYGPLRI